MKRYEALNWASSLLSKEGLEANYAKVFLQALLNETHTQFVLRQTESLNIDMLNQFQQGIQQHIMTGVPYQHLVGWAEFYGRPFQVSPDTLIPRFETEELVEWLVNDLQNTQQTIVDIGTGTGAIAITLKKECPQHELIMTDIYQPTLDMAILNAKTLDVHITSYLGDALQPLIDAHQLVDVIVSNPPYIACEEAQQLSKTVIDFDPHRALFAEHQGLAIYERIIRQALQVLNPQGRIYFEIGYQQGQAIKAIVLKYYPHATVEIRQDLNGKDRMIKISNL